MKAIAIWIKYLYRISKGFRLNVLLCTLGGVVSVGLTLTFIWLSKYIIDAVTSGQHCPVPRLIFLMAMMALCLLCSIAVTQLAKYVETRTTVKMTNRLSRHLFSGLMISSLEEGRYKFHSGDMLNRLTVDLKSLVTFVVTQLPAMVVMAVQLLGTFIFLATLSPMLAYISLGIMPICLLASKLYFRKQRRLAAEIRNNEGTLHVTMQEGLRHKSTLQSLECVDVMLHRQSFLQEKLNDNSRHQARLSAFSRTMTRIGFSLGFLVAFGWGVFNLNAGLITFGTLTAFIQLVSRLQSPIAGLAAYLPSIITNTVAIDRLREMENLAPQTHDEHHDVVEGPVGVSIRNLSFAYSADEDEVFHDFSYDFAPGSKTVVVGETGVGKSTLVKLFLGLLEPQKGEIALCDEQKRCQVCAATRSNFVYVPQGNTLLNGTIRDNLLLVRPDATEEELEEVLHLAAADFVYRLPLGLDTLCDETGNGLSEGQAQRIAIARALLRPGKIMLFDEYNSALDPTTAETLTTRIIRRYPNSTIIFISHRSDVRDCCDNVLNLNDFTPSKSELPIRY